MKLVALAIAGFAALGAGPALAQYGPYPPRPMMPVMGMPGENVAGIVRAMGLEPVGPPMRSGNVYIQRAADYYGKPLRIVVDAHRAQVVSVEPLGAPGSVHGGPYAAAGGPYGAGGPYWRRPYPGYGANLPPDEDDFDRLPGPQMQPARPAPKAKSAAVTPARPPVPRKRPVTAPQETAGTVEPLQAAPAQATPAPATPATPPVAPLE